MTKEKAVKIVLTDSQLAAIQFIAESFLRERIGQYWDIAEDLAGEGAGYRYDSNDPENHEKFNAYIDRRNAAEEFFRSGYRAAETNHLKTESVLIAEDIYETVRYSMWLAKKEPKPHATVDSRHPLHWGSEPLPVCTVNGDDCAIEITGAQMGLIIKMAECFADERKGDFSNLALDLVTEGCGTDTAGPRYAKVRQWFEEGYRASGADGRKTEWCERAEDILGLCRSYTAGRIVAKNEIELSGGRKNEKEYHQVHCTDPVSTSADDWL